MELFTSTVSWDGTVYIHIEGSDDKAWDGCGLNDT